MTLQGKGLYIWKIRQCEGGDPEAIAKVAEKGNLTHIMVKIADGIRRYNYDSYRSVDLVPPVVNALRERGIQTWGWHYVYGNDPQGEARRAIQRLEELNLDGYIIDAEVEYKEPGKDRAARTFVNELRAAYPRLTVALSSYRFPSYHPRLPWKEFLEKCDYNMPQVYWQMANNAGAQLERCIREFYSVTPRRPIIPTGAAYTEYDWTPTTREIEEFLVTSQKNKIEGANFWCWDSARSAKLIHLWETIRDFPWIEQTPKVDIASQFINALNKKDLETISTLYMPNAVHITAKRTIQGIEAIKDWYRKLVNEILPDVKYQLVNSTGNKSTRQLDWTTISKMGTVNDGSDTLGLVDEKIAYHYTTLANASI